MMMTVKNETIKALDEKLESTGPTEAVRQSTATKGGHLGPSQLEFTVCLN